jgi:hypothetical protein
MQQTASSPFLDYWHYAMMVGAVVMAISALVIYLVHNLRITAISSYKGKYDYMTISTHRK